ncbi:MAG: DUF2726 domain-containing protein [Pseudomonadota bacterium]
MPSEIIAVLDRPELLIALLAVGAFFGLVTERLSTTFRHRNWRQGKRHPWKRTPRTTATTPGPRRSARDLSPASKPDAADQLRIVMGAAFTVQPLLNKSEARVFKELDRMVIERNPAWQVMAQVSMGEILRSEDAEAFACINSKRVDLLLMDAECRPRHALEYQGGAHHQGTAAARDAVKKEALRKAGIGYHEIVAGHTTPAELRRLVEKLVDRNVPNGG